MMRARKGLALPAALAAIVVLAGLATLANVASLAAIREAAALREEAQLDASRDALRVRVGVQLARMPRDSLVSQPRAIGGSDTTMVVTPLAWPWHRVAVVVQGVQIFATLSHAKPLVVPWCAAVVVGGALAAPPGTLSLAPGSTCTVVLESVQAAAAVTFDSLLVDALVLPSVSDTLIATGSPGTTGVWRARRLIVVPPGASVSGILVAPVVDIGPGATIRGMVVARDSVRAQAGAQVIADELSAGAGLAALAALRPVGRRGALSPP